MGKLQPELEGQGLLQRTYGGAAFLHPGRFQAPLLETLPVQGEQKRAIALERSRGGHER